MNDEQQTDAAGTESLDDAEPEQEEEPIMVRIGDREFRYQPPQSDAQMFRYSHMEGKMVPA